MFRTTANDDSRSCLACATFFVACCSYLAATAVMRLRLHGKTGKKRTVTDTGRKGHPHLFLPPIFLGAANVTLSYQQAENATANELLLWQLYHWMEIMSGETSFLHRKGYVSKSEIYWL